MASSVTVIDDDAPLAVLRREQLRKQKRQRAREGDADFIAEGLREDKVPREIRRCLLGFVEGEANNDGPTSQAMHKQSRAITTVEHLRGAPISKQRRSFFHWCCLADASAPPDRGDNLNLLYTRNPDRVKLLKAKKFDGVVCDICGKGEQLTIARCWRKCVPGEAPPTHLEPQLAYVSVKCSQGLLGKRSSAAEFRESLQRVLLAENMEAAMKAWVQNAVREPGKLLMLRGALNALVPRHKPNDKARRRKAENDDIDLSKLQDPTPEELFEVLSNLTWPACQSRKNVMPDGTNYIEAFPMGIVRNYCKGMCLSSSLALWPSVAKIIARMVRRSHPDFAFTTLQLNRNYCAKMHVDGNNAGPSWSMAVGPFTGGLLWTADGSDACNVAEQVPQKLKGYPDLEVGECILGRLLDTRQPKLFNGCEPHLVTEMVGERISIVAFTLHNALELKTTDPAAWERLATEFEFPLPDEEWLAKHGSAKISAPARAAKKAKTAAAAQETQASREPDSDSDSVDSDDENEELHEEFGGQQPESELEKKAKWAKEIYEEAAAQGGRNVSIPADKKNHALMTELEKKLAEVAKTVSAQEIEDWQATRNWRTKMEPDWSRRLRKLAFGNPTLREVLVFACDALEYDGKDAACADNAPRIVPQALAQLKKFLNRTDLTDEDFSLLKRALSDFRQALVDCKKMSQQVEEDATSVVEKWESVNFRRECMDLLRNKVEAKSAVDKYLVLARKADRTELLRTELVRTELMRSFLETVTSVKDKGVTDAVFSSPDIWTYIIPFLGHIARQKIGWEDKTGTVLAKLYNNAAKREKTTDFLRDLSKAHQAVYEAALSLGDRKVCERFEGALREATLAVQKFITPKAGNSKGQDGREHLKAFSERLCQLEGVSQAKLRTLQDRFRWVTDGLLAEFAHAEGASQGEEHSCWDLTTVVRRLQTRTHGYHRHRVYMSFQADFPDVAATLKRLEELMYEAVHDKVMTKYHAALKKEQEEQQRQTEALAAEEQRQEEEAVAVARGVLERLRTQFLQDGFLKDESPGARDVFQQKAMVELNALVTLSPEHLHLGRIDVGQAQRLTDVIQRLQRAYEFGRATQLSHEIRLCAESAKTAWNHWALRPEKEQKAAAYLLHESDGDIGTATRPLKALGVLHRLVDIGRGQADLMEGAGLPGSLEYRLTQTLWTDEERLNELLDDSEEDIPPPPGYRVEFSRGSGLQYFLDMRTGQPVWQWPAVELERLHLGRILVPKVKVEGFETGCPYMTMKEVGKRQVADCRLCGVSGNNHDASEHKKAVGQWWRLCGVLKDFLLEEVEKKLQAATTRDEPVDGLADAWRYELAKKLQYHDRNDRQKTALCILWDIVNKRWPMSNRLRDIHRHLKEALDKLRQDEPKVSNNSAAIPQPGVDFVFFGEPLSATRRGSEFQAQETADALQLLDAAALFREGIVRRDDTWYCGHCEMDIVKGVDSTAAQALFQHINIFYKRGGQAHERARERNVFAYNEMKKQGVRLLVEDVEVSKGQYVCMSCSQPGKDKTGDWTHLFGEGGHLDAKAHKNAVVGRQPPTQEQEDAIKNALDKAERELEERQAKECVAIEQALSQLPRGATRVAPSSASKAASSAATSADAGASGSGVAEDFEQEPQLPEFGRDLPRRDSVVVDGKCQLCSVNADEGHMASKKHDKNKACFDQFFDFVTDVGHNFWRQRISFKPGKDGGSHCQVFHCGSCSKEGFYWDLLEHCKVDKHNKNVEHYKVPADVHPAWEEGWKEKWRSHFANGKGTGKGSSKGSPQASLKPRGSVAAARGSVAAAATAARGTTSSAAAAAPRTPPRKSNDDAPQRSKAAPATQKQEEPPAKRQAQGSGARPSNAATTAAPSGAATRPAAHRGPPRPVADDPPPDEESKQGAQKAATNRYAPELPAGLVWGYYYARKKELFAFCTHCEKWMIQGVFNGQNGQKDLKYGWCEHFTDEVKEEYERKCDQVIKDNSW
eukprot:TRINITY_DN9741_c0_g2_i1.p1 TRINITY_DN9741_c0_g2~~TRINITY_DN9741_c0_g2_i1.p1  ORF type:complete len:1978 (+),score=630.39 TRINITY_DN9741_c0_g2_i1:207-6140(+)